MSGSAHTNTMAETSRPKHSERAVAERMPLRIRPSSFAP